VVDVVENAHVGRSDSKLYFIAPPHGGVRHVLNLLRNLLTKEGQHLACAVASRARRLRRRVAIAARHRLDRSDRMRDGQADKGHNRVSNRRHCGNCRRHTLLPAGVDVQPELDRRTCFDLGVALGRSDDDRLARLRFAKILGQVDFDGQDVVFDFGDDVLHVCNLSGLRF